MLQKLTLDKKLNKFPLDWIKKLQKTYPQAQVYLVGGAVRDFLLDRETKDLDFVVKNLPSKELEVFLEKCGKVNLVGKSFGVYKFREVDGAVDVSTPPAPPARGGNVPKVLADFKHPIDSQPLAKPKHTIDLQPLAKSKHTIDSKPLIDPQIITDSEVSKSNTNTIQENTIEDFDIALPRTEHSFNTGGYKDVEVTSDYLLDIEKDLERRDFTINAIAVELTFKKTWQGKIIDPFNGQVDLQNKLIKTVGNPDERFGEDATRILRAVRFACQLDFELDKSTLNSIKQKSDLIKKVAPERIATELNKIILSPRAEFGFRLMRELDILKIIMPELDNCYGVEQSRNHIYEVFEHSVRALGFAVKNNQSLEVRWASLFHDIGKPPTKAKQGEIYTFYNHEKVSARLTVNILNRLRFPEKTVKKISHLVFHHMFYYNIGEITDSAVRRLIQKVGLENIDDLINMRIADRLGMGRPKGKPFKLIELERRVKEVSLDPLSVKMLKINGQDLMNELNIAPGPKIGLILNALLNIVLENPAKNTREFLLTEIKKLNKLTENKLKKLAPDLAKHEEERREQLIGKPLVFKGEKLNRLVRKIKK